MSLTRLPSAARGGAAVRALLWMAAGVLLAALVLVDPLGVLPVDDWIDRTQGGASDSANGRETRQLWTCGMHPQVVQEEPGQCPICGMDLTPMQARDDGAEQGSVADRAAVELWTCPMHPDVLQEEPGQCPICGMDLVPFESGAGEVSASKGAASRSVVRIDPTVVQNMNVTTRRAVRRDLERRIRTVGYLEYDQEKMVSVTTKYPGYVEKVYVSYIGQPIRRGEPLFDIYSPQLVQTEKELLAAARYVDSLEAAAPDVRRRATSLLEAARERLRYWDITPEQIADIESGGEIPRTLSVFAPASGVLMKRVEGLEGMHVTPGMEVVHIADMSTLWLSVEVYEDDLAWLDVGSTAKISLTHLPGESLRGRVRLIEPEVSEGSRTVSLTLRVPNRDGRLRVGMYATVVFEPVVAEDALTVPSQSVIRTGERDVVVVALGDGRFAPRSVTLGPSGDGVVQVLDGLEAGERVVTSAQFLIDSESNLQEAVRKMIDAGGGHDHGG